MSNIRQKLGWKRPLPSPKPFKYAAPHNLTVSSSVDLEPLCPPVYDQSSIGSCTAQASAALCQFTMRRLGYKWFTPSRLALYYWTRAAEGTAPADDAGASVQDAITMCHSTGCPNESLWWHNVPAKMSAKPNQKVVADANKHKISQPLAVNHYSINDLQACLYSGTPFIFGFTVFQSFEQGDWDTSTGIMPLPRGREQVLGGHAVMAVGYDNSLNAFKIRNSWSTSWGLKGYFWMPYSFITSTNYADDFWTCQGFDTWSA